MRVYPDLGEHLPSFLTSFAVPIDRYRGTKTVFFRKCLNLDRNFTNVCSTVSNSLFVYNVSVVVGVRNFVRVLNTTGELFWKW